MSFIAKLRSRSQARANHRAIHRAIAEAPNRSVRDEILLAAQRSGISTHF